MKEPRRFALLFALCALVLVLAAPLVAQEGQGAEMSDMPEMSEEEMAAMKAWQEAMMPGEEHARLAEMAGDWSFVSRFWMEPGGEPMVSDGHATLSMDMGGRHLVDRTEGSFMDMPFVGEGRTGYDNVTGEYWGTWVDNMSTGVMVSRGHWDDEVGGLVMHSEYADPETGETSTMRTVSTMEGDDKMVLTGYEMGDDGEEWKSMEIVYTRE